MADKKFSDFTNQAFDTTNTQLVGFKQGDTTNNYRYNLTQLQTGILTGADNSILTNNAGYLATVDLQNDVTGVLPADHGGTGVTGTNGQKMWNAVQQFVWTNGTPIVYTSITNNTGVYLPFNTTAIIDVSTNTAANTKWTAANSAQGVGNVSEQCTFTLGVDGGGTWLIQAMIPMFDLDDNTTARLALDIDGSEIAIFEHNWQAGRSGVPAQSLYGNLTYTFSGGENVKLLFYGNGSGGGFFPAGDSVTEPFFNSRPPEITFTKVV